jgi:hypothetical protein
MAVAKITTGDKSEYWWGFSQQVNFRAGFAKDNYLQQFFMTKN